MINLSTILKALQAQLSSNVDVTEIFKKDKITRGQYINNDPSRCPWLGIYRGTTDFEPRTLGSVNNWEAFPKAKIIVQAISYKSGEQAEELLEGYVEAVMDAVLTDTSIGNTVDMVTGMQVEYGYNEEVRETVYFQSAIITFNLEVATQ